MAAPFVACALLHRHPRRPFFGSRFLAREGLVPSLTRWAEFGGQDPAPEGMFGNDRRWGKPEPDQMLKHRPDTTLAALENRCTLARTVGSNPALSPNLFKDLAGTC